MKEYEFHELAEQYPLMGDEQLQELVVLMEEYGFLDAHPIVLYEGKILAGRDRYRAAKLAGVPICTVDLQEGIPPEVYVEVENEHRKHLTPEFLAERKRKRVERVAEKRREGKSTRTIAEEEGVTQTQVIRDIKEASTETGVSVEPPDGKVKSKDGRTRPAAKPKKPEPWDEETTSEAPKPSANGKPAKQIRDGKNLPVPEHLLPVWAEIEKLEAVISDLRRLERRVNEWIQGPAGYILAENLKKRSDGTYAMPGLHSDIFLLKSSLPWLSRCPECLGQKRKNRFKRCPDCDERGWITADTFRRIDMAGSRAIEALIAAQEEADRG